MAKKAEKAIEEATVLGGMMDVGDAERTGIYEVGYHLLSSLSDAEVIEAVKDLTSLLKGKGATFIGEKLPERIDLAYTIEKKIDGRLLSFNQAYFGWVAFEINSSELGSIKTYLDTTTHFLRYLLISTNKAEVTASMEGMKIRVATAQASTAAIAAPKRAEEESGEVSTVALDAALKDMESEDAKKPE
ncbi:MAG: 30S ribosomal protein S6 [Patescibacteria group bacterium]